MDVMTEIKQKQSDGDLWKSYFETRNDRIREKLVLQYIPLVKYVIGRQLSHLPPHLPREDLMSAGIMGLINAVERYNPNLEVQFKTYAIPRIKGAILDELRSYDIIPRSIRLKMKELQQSIRELESELGRTPGEEEIADKMGLKIDSYRDLLRRLSPIRFLSLSQTLNNAAEWDIPDATADATFSSDDNELKSILISAIQKLEKNERLMIALYYYEKMTMKEIAVVLKVSESRISQVHTQAILKLRSVIEKTDQN